MRIISPSFEIIGNVNPVEILKNFMVALVIKARVRSLKTPQIHFCAAF